MMKVIIAGGRDFNDYNKLRNYCDYLLQNKTDIEIVSGAARGADKLGERYGEERGYKISRFPADWDLYGKSAGYRRNEDMAYYADALILFWNKKSRGSQHMLKIGCDEGLEIRVFYY